MNFIRTCGYRPQIAYFSMEIALQPRIPTYSGGLGVLAGDTLRSAADLGLPLVGVTLVSRFGYLRQEIDFQGHQVEHSDPWQPEKHAQPLGAKITVELEGHEVWIRPWLYRITGATGKCVAVILLDTDVDENSPEDRELSHYLYGGDDRYRLKQEAILGIGGIRMLHALGLHPHAFHMNEGHSALLGMELAQQYTHPTAENRQFYYSFSLDQVRKACIFTTHTPVSAGHDQYEYDLFLQVLDGTYDVNDLKILAGEESLNMTRLALNLSGFVNGVAKRHAQTSEAMFPGYHVHAITNGVHPRTWTCDPFLRLYDDHLPGWCHEPELLVRADQIDDDAVWSAHQEAKRELLYLVKQECDVTLDPELPIIGFARRMTGYKRPDLLFSDIDRLLAIHKNTPFQILFAGKSHHSDLHGKQIIEQIHHHIRELRDRIAIVFVPNYDMVRGRLLVSGSDIWLNTPIPPMEASGTSGMKASFNGVPNLSVLDGWWVEGCIEGVTGWSIGDHGDPATAGQDSASLYDKLEQVVLPLYHGDRRGWIQVMKGAISKNASYFHSHRMMRRYATEAYQHPG
jgi:starch phosphorylase